MPTSRRDAMKRKLYGVISAMNRADRHLKELYEIYKPYHPEYAELYKLMAENNAMTRDMAEQIIEKI